MGNKQRALEVLEEATKTDPKPFHALADIAKIYLNSGDYKEATKWANKSLKLNPKFIYPAAILAVIALITKQDDSLVKSLKKIEVDRYDILRKDIERRLGHKADPSYIRRLNIAFKVAGKPITKK